MSPLGRRRGSALRASIRRPLSQTGWQGRAESPSTSADSSSSKTSSSRAVAHSVGPAPGRQGLPPELTTLLPKNPLCRLKFGQIASKLPPRRGQDGPRWQDDGKIASRCQLESNLGSTWANLNPTWPILAPSWPHLGGQNEHFAWEGLHFWHFGDSRLKKPKMAPRWPQEAPKRPQDGPKRLQEGPKWPQEAPRRAQGEPRTAPRRPQVASKSPPSRLQVAFKNHLIS